MKYRKKPVIIEAKRWYGTAEGATKIIQWVLDNGGTARYHDKDDDFPNELPSQLAIDTLEGTMLASPGDWIIQGVQGEFYPCKPDIFEATYEAMEDSRWFAANARIGWLIERVEDGKRFRIAGLHDGDVLTLTTTDPQEPGPTFKTSDWPFTIFKVEET